MDKATFQLKFKDNGGNEEEYKVEIIYNSAVYVKKSESGHLLGLYYLVSWKNYLKEKNTWEPALVTQHLWRLLSIFHKNYPDKPIATLPPVNIGLLTSRPTVKLFPERSAAK